MDVRFLRVAEEILKERPGLTSREIVQEALARGVTSTAPDPFPSLEGTVSKHWRRRGWDRRLEGGHYRYFPPRSEGRVPERRLPRGRTVTLDLPLDLAEIVETMVEVDIAKSRSAAVVLLAQKGMAQMKGRLGEVKKAKEQIERLKAELRPWRAQFLEEPAELLSLSGQSDPVLNELWDNERDAAYDRV